MFVKLDVLKRESTKTHIIHKLMNENTNEIKPKELKTKTRTIKTKRNKQSNKQNKTKNDNLTKKANII